MNERVAPPSFSARLAAHFSGIEARDVDDAALEAARLSMLDTLAVARAGLDAQGVPQVRALALHNGGRADARVWGFRHRLPMAEAAFVNGVAAAALDFDALHHGGLVHADIVALPAVLAVAESRRASGLDTLVAYVLALDLTARLGMAAPGHRGWFYTSIHGVYGAAAASARLLDLPQQGITDALGLAFAQASGTQQSMLERSVSKRLLSAFAARAGVFAAQLSGHGLAGPQQAFEGPAGASALYEALDTDRVLDGLGTRWENAAIGFKPFPVCGSSLAALQATLDLVRTHDLRPHEVRAVRVMLPVLGFRSVGAPYQPPLVPEIDAQFSARYAVAAALLRRDFTVADLGAARALDSAAVALAQTIQVEADPQHPGHMVPVSVHIETSRGLLSGHVTEVPGGPARPLRREEVIAKARACLTSGPRPLTSHQCEAFIGRVLHLDALDDINQLWDDEPG